MNNDFKQISNCMLTIDAALSMTGFAVLDMDTEELLYVDRIMTSHKDPQNDRVTAICRALRDMLNKYHISHVIIEDGFCHQNFKTGLQLAALRGAIEFMFNDIDSNIQIYAIPPSKIRKLLGCGGNATKEEVAQTVINRYKNSIVLKSVGEYDNRRNHSKTSDIYDAIAIGLAFLNQQKGG